MPGPGGFRGGFHGGRGWGPGFFGRGNPILDVVTGVATGAVVAAALTPRPVRRRCPPRDGYIYVVESGAPVRAVRMEDASFIISRVNIPSYTTGDNGEVQYIVEVTINDGYKYTVGRRYSQFDDLRARVQPVLTHATPSFPPKYPFQRLGPDGLDDRRRMLMAWMQSLITAARAGSVSLRIPIYNFLETTSYYPPELPSEGAAAVAAPANSSTSRQAVPAQAMPAQAMPLATAVPDSSPSAPPSDGWSVPVWSREASDMKLAMSGPDKDGFLAAGAVAQALRAGTGADTADLRAIWELSDIDKDGKLDREEFALAWYLAQKAAGGQKPPAVLPSDLVPPSKRRPINVSAANPF